ncbi:MAG: tripartite tricarboxylate transporter substrate binding protein [Comamonadaceae bacterium]|nr:tripartite tricarboxylate transporter substrate binding protein [Comamonadaceae bacterium]
MMNVIKKALLVFLASLSVSVAAQTYPGGPVRLVVPYPAGGGVDAMARGVADKLGKMWGKSVMVDNRPGAATIIGTDYVAKSAPDGLTLLFTSDSSITSNPHLYAKLPFDALKDLEPVTQLIDLPLIVVVNPAVKARTMSDLIALAKAQPGKLNYASFGPGSQPNLLFETLRLQTGATIAQIPYKGIAPALNATLAGETEVTLGGANWIGHYKSGTLRPLAVDRAKRIPIMPDVPTFAEAGFPGLNLRSWFGLFAPKGTPQAVLEKVRADVVTMFKDPEFIAKEVTAFGYAEVGSSPKDFKAFVQSDFDYKAKMIKAADIKVE